MIMDKKKILFVIPTLRNGGGTIRSLQNLLLQIPDIYNIDVLPLAYNNKNISQLKNCQIIPYKLILVSIISNVKHIKDYKFKYIVYIIKSILKIFAIIGLRIKFENLLFSIAAKDFNKYNTIIAYEEGPCTRFASKIKSTNKIAWIHCDYSIYWKNNNKNDEKNTYKQYNRIVCVSAYTLKMFLQVYPIFHDKSRFIYNILDNQHIYSASNEKIESNLFCKRNKVILLSIGRIVPLKQFSLIPQIISKMRSNNFVWYLIGDIDDENEFRSLNDNLVNYKIQNFVYLGHKNNPYPYIKNADILVSLSISEACPYVVNEAKVLHTPVVSNNYPSIYEFIEDKYDGMICQIDKIHLTLDELIQNKTKLNNLKLNIKKFEYNNENLVQSIIHIL